ncbi:hypothetical protein CDSM653_00576 [Caldanaerobacter subterraneus subsp. pacificus DSM 12653]|uniref:Uncharacterized protein n=1 Tax=Caldanaerobacter subterraneus subsp. pacificus DSM 12653 TaxID=391606 RepID=A0A0F5PPQ6_9THEO|nr:hypothetical protein CDSM653_00576 [Caldanaerobacter subterraneus subsp. pacificus DSM 12653]
MPIYPCAFAFLIYIISNIIVIFIKEDVNENKKTDKKPP